MKVQCADGTSCLHPEKMRQWNESHIWLRHFSGAAAPLRAKNEKWIDPT